jgi:hypothetical protein
MLINHNDEDGTHRASTHLHDMVVSAVRLVPKGANGRNGLLICKADEAEAATPPVPVETPAENVVKTASETPTETPPVQQPETPSVTPEPDPVEIEKGLRVAQARLAQMWSAFNAMADLMKDLVEEVTAPRTPKPAPAPEPTGLEIAMGEMARKARAQEEELARLRKNHGSSNAIPIDGVPGVPAPFVWPSDMNDSRKDPRSKRGQ